MFRVEFLNIKSHPQLGTISLNFSDENEFKNKKPYSTLIIGPNGTGKSFILRSVADIFRQFKAYTVSDKREFSLPFDIHLRYKINDNTYEIVTKNFEAITKRGIRRNYLFLKNRPLDFKIKEKNVLMENVKEFEISYKELEFPEKLLVNSIIPTDRFTQQNSNRNDFYQYLGARSTSSTSSTKSAIRKTIKHIFSATSSSVYFIENLKELLGFLDFEDNFEVIYKTKINKLFFSETLSKKDFKTYFENWWLEDFEYTKRKRENPLWSIPYYNTHFKNNEELTEMLIEYLNQLPKDKEKFSNKPKSSSKIIKIDLLNPKLTENDLIMLSHLENLDIINLEGISVQKRTKKLNIGEISSGEYHLLISMIAIFANINPNSLILIDEPEISLHPNWQMRYMTFLKNVFQKYSNCHFIITTHSHFLISDLEGDNSAVIVLNRNDENRLQAELLEGINTFGWASEDVLFRVFGVRSIRNHYFEMAVGDLLDLLASKSKKYSKIRELLGLLKRVETTENDPLKELIKETEYYLEDAK